MKRPGVTVSLNFCYQATHFLLTTFVFLGPFGTVSATPSDVSMRVEVFTTNGREFVGQHAIRINEQVYSVDLQVYELNGIKLAEAELSNELTADPDQSKRLALQRIQVLDDQTRTRMHRSAIGLAKSMQYSVDRFPAIVFDGQAVVYGITDLKTALAHYQAWRTGDVP